MYLIDGYGSERYGRQYKAAGAQSFENLKRSDRWHNQNGRGRSVLRRYIQADTGGTGFAQEGKFENNRSAHKALRQASIHRGPWRGKGK